LGLPCGDGTPYQKETLLPCIEEGFTMPYIKKEDRKKFESAEVGMGRIETVGELNYFITRTCLNYIKNNGFNYQKINDILGVLSAVGHEFYRRLFKYYEDLKIYENGDVLTDEEKKVMS
jgi:hypothetical protein